MGQMLGNLFDPLIQRRAEIIAPIIGRLPEHFGAATPPDKFALKHIDRCHIHQLRRPSASRHCSRRHGPKCPSIVGAAWKQVPAEN